MIVAVALRMKSGALWTAARPARHDALYDMLADFLGTSIREINAAADADPLLACWKALTDGHDQGFVTEKLEFLGRVEAMEHAIACGQIEPQPDRAGLMSEDLW